MSIEYVQLQLASPSEIKRWSQRVLPTGEVVGEISKADTINYRTFKPERGGLFCERIFGSTSNGECSCGKTKRRKLIAPLNFNRLTVQKNDEVQTAQSLIEVCPSCGVEPTNAKVRRYRMGCISLKKPVAHMWYFRNSPNVLATLLNMRSQDIDEIIHFQTYTSATPGTQNYCLHGGVQWYVNHWEPMHPYFAGTTDFNFDKVAPWNMSGSTMPPEPKTIENCGAEALQVLLSQLDLAFLQKMLSRKLHNEIEKQKFATKRLRKQHKRRKKSKLLSRNDQKNYGISTKVKKYARRLEYVRSLARKGLRPEWMVLSVFPVLPPDLRPMIQMSSGRFATSDLNDLYRRLIYRKIRFEKFLTLFDEEFLPDLLIRHDLCLLQEAADSIIDNGRLEKPAQRPNRKAFKSLTSIIEGKHGRFRQNLLGKRVDYSGRSVIVVGPKLRLHQCGLPREMALELFQPFVIRALLEESGVKNIRAAKNLLQRRPQMVWDILETVVTGHPVLLNRAPTLHRLGIQAFEPILLSGRAIQLHPLVCPAFNADFDGDQMAVHVPLGLEAQAEARLLMLATHNWLSPATGEPSILPSQDMILGFYYLTTLKPSVSKVPKVEVLEPGSNPITVMRIAQSNGIFTNFQSVLHAYGTGALDLHEMIWLRWSSYIQTNNPKPVQITVKPSGHITTIYDTFVMESGLNFLLNEQVELTNSKQLFNQKMSSGSNTRYSTQASLSGYNFYIRTTPGRVIFNNLLYENLFCNRTVDKGEMKRLIKWVLLNYGTEKTTRLIDQLKTMGFHYATHAGLSLGIDDLRIPPIKSTFLKNADQDIYENDLRLQRGQITSVQRLEKALDIWNTTNDTLKTEVIKYFRATDIFNPVYMMAFSGARGNISQVRQLVGMRGLMADPQGQVLDFPIRRNFREGLTVTEYMISCYGARKGLVDTALRTASSGYLTRRLVDVAQSVIIQQVDCHTTQGLQIIPNAKQMDSQLIGRVLFDNVIDVETGRIIGYKNQDISPALALKLVKQPTLTIRSPLTCKFHAVCQLCYGWNLAQQKLVQLGEAVGVLAAQSIGEPGTQLTMRTFHTGGVFAGEVTEKVYSPHAGTVFYSVNMRGRKVLSKYGEIAFLTFEPIQIKVKNLNQTSILNFPALSLLYVAPGQVIEAHQSLAELSRIEVKRKMMQFDQEAENLRKEFTASQSGQVFLPQRYRSLSTSFGISQVSNYTEMWLLGGLICNSQELIPGDKMNLISHPMSWKSLNTPGKVQPKILVDSFMSRTNRTNRDLSDMDRYFLTNFQLTDKTNLPSDTLTFIRNYYLELNNSVSTAIGEKACSFTPVNLSVSFKFKALQFASQKLLAMQTTSTKGYRNKTVSKFSVYSKLKLSRLTKYSRLSAAPPTFQDSVKKLTIPMLMNPLMTVFANNFALQNVVTANKLSIENLYSFAGNLKISGNFLPLPTTSNIQTFKPTITKGILMPFGIKQTTTDLSLELNKMENKAVMAMSGEIRAVNCLLNDEHQTAFKVNPSELTVKLGDYARIEDQLTLTETIPLSGQVNFLNSDNTVVRSVQPYLLVPGSELQVSHGRLVQKHTVLGTLISAESKGGDIVQGLPKVDELLEAREPQHKLFTSMHAKLSTLFYQYGKMYGLREGCELSFQKIRQFLVQEVQDVYQSQGVYIGDKHVEIIVRQMTTHVVVIDPGKTGLLPGDIIDIRRIEQLEHEGSFAGVKYRPILLGITRAALMAESFISAASFQETKRVLAKAALEGQIDWLTGLKENVILGRLIPAGTGLY